VTIAELAQSYMAQARAAGVESPTLARSFGIMATG